MGREIVWLRMPAGGSVLILSSNLRTRTPDPCVQRWWLSPRNLLPPRQRNW